MRGHCTTAAWRTADAGGLCVFQSGDPAPWQLPTVTRPGRTLSFLFSESQKPGLSRTMRTLDLTTRRFELGASWKPQPSAWPSFYHPHSIIRTLWSPPGPSIPKVCSQPPGLPGWLSIVCHAFWLIMHKARQPPDDKARGRTWIPVTCLLNK